MTEIVERRGIHFSRPGWGIGFYKVGLTWVLLLQAPHFGLIHLGSPYWWKPLLLFPRALPFHLRALFAKSL